MRVLETRGHSVKMWANIPFNPKLTSGGMVVDPEGLGQIIGDTFKSARLSKRRVVCAINVQQAMSRILTIHDSKGPGLAKAVEREIRPLLPTAQEDSLVYWQPLESRSPLTQQRVYVLTVPKMPVQAMVAALKVAEVKPLSMDLRTLALARSINRRDGILANLETNSLDVVVVVDDLPVLIHSVYLGDDPISMAEAQDRLLAELTTTIVCYNDANRSKPLAPAVPVFLTGDLASDPDLVARVEQSTGHLVGLLEPPLVYPSDFLPAQYMVNIGLALKEL